MEYKAQYQEYLLQATAALDAASARFLPEESEVCRAARYSLLGGGKRIRAILTLSVCDMLGGEMQVAAQFAAAVEMLHCYSLIHDDLPCMDNDDLRRGRPSCHKAFSESTAMLAGDVLLTEAHARGLSLEAWVNPYRLRSSASMPPVLAENSLLNTHPEWVCTVNEGAYLNPAIPEAADYVVQGVAELVQNYAVDGIHFDDYFYPTTDPSIDAAQFAASGETDLTAWRRANVTRLVKAAHDAVKAADPTLRFGVSPQGNPDNDRNEQYTNLSVWLTASGADAVVDYLCPQIYWGYGYTLSSGSTRFAFENITAEWLALPRAESTALYFGLGAYRVGVGDGGANADSVSQWCTGSALARQVTDLRSAGAGGWALYRYGSLFRSDESGLAAAERAAMTALDG